MVKTMKMTKKASIEESEESTDDSRISESEESGNEDPQIDETVGLSDDDAALQEAYNKNELKPGLHRLVPHFQREIKNDVAGLKQKQNDIKLKYDWIEMLDVVSEPAPVTPEMTAQFGGVSLDVTLPAVGTSTRRTAEKQLAQDDFKREMFFYRQAQGSAIEALHKLHGLKVLTKRPEDYFAQMVKSDSHMKKVREALLSEHLTIERQQKAKKLRELRKYSKEVQRETLQKRQKDKKMLQEAIKKHNKGRGGKLDALLEESKGKDGARKNGAKGGLSVKQKFKNSRYGFGGKKKGMKSNTAESSGDIDSFKVGKHTDRKPRKNKKTFQRPGKNRRMNERHKQKNRK
jgi:rRNA-processing protein EBP2